MMMKQLLILRMKCVQVLFLSILLLIKLLSHRSAALSINKHELPKTSAVLKVTYDGTLFHGWTAGNIGTSETLDLTKSRDGQMLNRRGRSRRNRNRPSMRKGEVRSVKSVLSFALAKLYGNVDPKRIVIEGSSRTDAGVSARSMIALIYCLHDDFDPNIEMDQMPDYTGTCTIAGKRLPHPISPTDEGFKPLPFQSDLKRMIYALNKMLPPDVRIADATYTPKKAESGRPFHPSMDSICKTYSYTFSIGELYDPIRSRNVWHVPNTKSFDLKHANDCISELIGQNDFQPFRGAFRGNERGKVQDTICTVRNITIVKEKDDYLGGVYPCCSTYKVTVIGDRFLYKMVRFLVGFIVHYGTNPNTSVQQVKGILSTGEWNNTPRICAPANGLVLEEIEYEDELEFNWIVHVSQKAISEKLLYCT